MRDLIDFDENKIRDHYKLYQALLDGLGVDIKKEKVPAYGLPQPTEVGSEDDFVKKLLTETKLIRPYIKDVYKYISQTWADNNHAYVFEKAQAIGLDPRWGVYPDVTASDTTFEGIFSATDGVIDPNEIKIRAAVNKATYMSSVGRRELPTIMENNLATRIREDAKEYGATTKRPRDIAYVDVPALRFFSKVGRINCQVLTHMDVVYPDVPILVCTGYEIKGESVTYRPDQEYLSKVTPVYEELPSWDRQEIQNTRNINEIPKNARRFLDFMAEKLDTPILMITTGPRRNQSINC
jgi:adenylosuccinate synthase